jgi:orotidine-5'-phosphate decarboxylase
VVCSVHEVARVHAARPDYVTVVPGVRFAEGDAHDQARVGTPESATRAGANVLVIGRAVTGAPDPRAAAKRAFDAVANSVTKPPLGD